MQTVNIHQAKTHLSKLIEMVLQDEEIIIAKAGKPVAKLTPYQAQLKPRTPGLWKGKAWIADDFNS